MNRSRVRTIAFTGFACLMALPWTLSAADAEDSPVLWPERDREFFSDGPGLLLGRGQSEKLVASAEAERTRWIDDFLASDPIPQTPENELIEAIDRRRRLVFSEFNSFLDDRARTLFLHGSPLERRQVECGQTFQPIEVWTYAETVSRHQLLFYRRGTEGPHRLWIPLDSKLALYNKDMAYWLQQYEELRGRIRGKRFDIKACKDALFIDKVTGVDGLRGYRSPRPTNQELLDVLKAPADLAQWANEAAQTTVPEKPAELEITAGEFLFPERRGQRIVARQILTVPPDAELGLFKEEETETQTHKLTVEGTVEQDGTVFEEFRVRFQIAPPEEDVPAGLAIERALRPGRVVLLRLKVIDEVSGGVARFASGMRVPSEPEAVAEIAVPDAVIVEMEDALALEAIAGDDSLLLAPPDGRLALGNWRAEVLVSGKRIVEVVFSVDGRPQLRRKQPPFGADVRLSEFPTEQVVRAEGFDADGELVAFDEVVLNQPRGVFSVRILSPGDNDKVSGRVQARAEIAVPDERRIQRVEFLLNDELVATLDEDPWRTMIDVPDKSEQETAYLTVVATLDNGDRAEAVRFLNSPQFAETVEVNLVEMLVTVLDKSNRPVPDLPEEEFKVFEDGRPQVIDRFELVKDLPLSIGIAIDTSGSMATALPEAQKAAVGFLRDVLTPRDRAFLLSFSKDPVLLVPPTDDLGAIEESLEDLQSLGWTALHDAIVTSLYYFKGFRGQRALILLSDGDDSASRYAFREALEYARRSGVVVYAVGLDVGSMKTGIQNKLSKLASETGGRHFFIREAAQLEGVYREIEQELRSQYLVAYTSDNPASDEAFRTIELKVRDGKLSARTLRGYYPN
ncbi:MAG: VWA domain-containing protein [bacterium]|nr:VWA domain-containing protein [bacterium]